MNTKSSRRFVTSFLLGLSALTGAADDGAAPATDDTATARATTTAAECIAEHADGQVLRQRGSLLAAKQKFLACAAEACPAMVREECARFVTDVDTRTPTVVFAVVDDAGHDVPGATARIDDAAPPIRLDGRALPLDPGAHRFAFEAPGIPPQSLTIVVRESEKFRRVTVKFAAAPAAPEPHHAPRIPLAALVFGGVGVAATTSFIYFGLSGHAKQSELESHCAPRCTHSDVDTMRARYLAADISLGTAIVAFGLGTYFLLNAPASEPQKKLDARRRPEPSVKWTAAVTQNAALLSATGRF